MRALRSRGSLASHLGREVLDHILDSFHQHGPFPEQTIAAARLATERAAGNREDLAILLERHPRGYQRTALLRRLDNHDAKREARQDTVAAGEVLRQRRGAQREFAQDGAAAFDNRVGEPAMLGW